MKKKYILPEIKLMKLPTENVMAALSSANVSDYKGGNDNQGINPDIDTWDGSEIESAKENNNSFGFWDDEE